MDTGTIPAGGVTRATPVAPANRRTLLLLGGALLAVATVVVVVVALSTRGPATYPPGSPEAAYQAYYTAWQAADLESAYALFSSRIRAEVSVDEYRALASDHSWQRDQERRVVLTGSQVNGDRARLDLRADEFSRGGGVFGLGGGEVWESYWDVSMVREDGNWRVDDYVIGLEHVPLGTPVEK